MPAGAYAIVALFAAVSVISGSIAAWTIGPRRIWAVGVPSSSAFGALYLIGHRMALSLGPEIGLFGFRISLPFDVAAALVTAFAAAALQGGLVRLLEPEQGSPRRDGLT